MFEKTLVGDSKQIYSSFFPLCNGKEEGGLLLHAFALRIRRRGSMRNDAALPTWGPEGVKEDSRFHFFLRTFPTPAVWLRLKGTTEFAFFAHISALAQQIKEEQQPPRDPQRQRKRFAYGFVPEPFLHVLSVSFAPEKPPSRVF